MDTNQSFASLYNFFPNLANKLLEKSNYWNGSLQTILKHIQNSDEGSNLMSHQFWKNLIAKFEPYHLNHDQKMEFLQLIGKLIKVNYGNQKVQHEVEFCGQLGAKFHKLQNTLHFKHKQSLEYFKFMSIKIFHDNLKNEFCFTDLKFDFSIEETDKVASKVRQFCSYDMDAFAFLSLYLQMSVKNRICKDSLKKVEEDYLNQLNNLAKQYPPNSFEIEHQNNGFKLQKVTSYKIMERYFFQNNGASHLDELKNLIIKKAQDAKKEQQTFEILVKEICYRKGYSFKSGVKIKSPQNSASIFRTVQKLIEDLLEQKQEFQYSAQFEQVRLKRIDQGKSYSVQELKRMIEEQKQSSFRKIQRILEEQRSIVFDSKDLVRGKCTFSSVEDVIETVNSLRSHITNSGYMILEVKDRLQKNTKDAVVIIKLSNSIAELQLVVKLDSLANQFNHKIYQLKRSKLYSPITNLFVHNQMWCEKFFTQLFQLFDTTNNVTKSYDFQESFKFRDFNYDLQDFKSKYLNPFAINHIQDQKFKQQEKCTIDQSFKALIDIILKKEYQHVNSNARKQQQKINEVKFYKDNIDYEKGLQLLFFIQRELSQPDTQLLKLKGDIMFEKGMLQEALNCYFNCVNLYESGLKSQNQKLAYGSILNQIGLVYYSMGKYSQSLQYYEKCLSIKKLIKGQQSSTDTSSILNNIGGIYEKKGNYPKALEFYLKCLQIKEKAFGKQSIEVATTLNNIGSVYDGRGNYVRALEYYERSLEIKMKVKGKDSIDVAITLNNIGSVYDSSGNFNKALEYYQRCLNLKTKIKGAESIDVATLLNNIGVLCEHKGQYNLALQNYEKCLNIQIQIKGPNSIDVATTMNNIGLVYTNNNQFGNALQYFEKCLQIQTDVKGRNSIDVATTLNNIGFVNWKQGNLQKALQNYHASLQTEKITKGESSIDVATTINNIGSVYHTKKDYLQAIQSYKKCLQIHEKIGEKNSIDVAAILNNLGLVYNDKGELKQALDCYEKCLGIKMKIKGENSIDVATTLNNLSFLHQKMNQIEKSYDCAKKSFEIRLQHLGSGHQYTKMTQRQMQKMHRVLTKLN